jgi:hypothetical protein
MVTKALRVPVLNIEQWSDFGRKVLAPPPKYTARLRPESVGTIESIIGHKIARPHLLAQALVWVLIVLVMEGTNKAGLDSFFYTRI